MYALTDNEKKSLTFFKSTGPKLIYSSWILIFFGTISALYFFLYPFFSAEWQAAFQSTTIVVDGITKVKDPYSTLHAVTTTCSCLIIVLGISILSIWRKIAKLVNIIDKMNESRTEHSLNNID